MCPRMLVEFRRPASRQQGLLSSYCVPHRICRMMKHELEGIALGRDLQREGVSAWADDPDRHPQGCNRAFKDLAVIWLTRLRNSCSFNKDDSARFWWASGEYVRQRGWVFTYLEAVELTQQASHHPVMDIDCLVHDLQIARTGRALLESAVIYGIYSPSLCNRSKADPAWHMSFT